jgi:oligoribonuclease (3'-5' exoribonuclease)
MSRFVAIDLETTGLDAEKCQIIEIGAVIDDWLTPLELKPTFHCYVKRAMYTVQPHAAGMHETIWKRIATEEEGYLYLYPGDAAKALGNWMEQNGAYVIDPENPEREARATVVGKNFASFDDRFLRRLPRFDEHVKYHHRILDPGSLFWNPLIDVKLPGQSECLRRAGLPDTVTHNALGDAQQVVHLVHAYVSEYNRLRDSPTIRFPDNPFPGPEKRYVTST